MPADLPRLLPISITVGAQSFHGTYAVDGDTIRVRCGKLEGEAVLGVRPVKRAAEQLLKALVERAAKAKR